MEPVLLTKNQIKSNELKDYLIASASCFPASKIKNIQKDYYVDGGLYDNLPINFAIDMGSEEIIEVGLKEIGIKQKVKNRNVKIITISLKIDIGSFLVLNRYLSKE